jgi:hypothetical protein
MATTTARAFTIYIDSPPTSPVKRRAPAARPMLRSRSASCTNTLSSPFLVCPDKENTHPVTGERANSVGPAGKGQKRKTGVLETKHYEPPAAKKLKEGKPIKATNKRRAASVPLPDTPETSSQDTAVPEPTKKATKRKLSTRKIPILPKVEEERETEDVPQPLPTTQAEIDSRCYDLTVRPLADVSEAYEAVPLSVGEPVASKPARKTKPSKTKVSRIF